MLYYDKYYQQYQDSISSGKRSVTDQHGIPVGLDSEAKITEKIETIIVGGGQAGLATSYFLKQRGHEHIVLEQAAQAGNAWRNDRWDSFRLLTPNWSFQMPGAEYQAEEPDQFMSREAIVARFEQLVESAQLPVQFQTQVTSIVPEASGQGYQIRTQDRLLHAKNVVVSTGLYQRPKLPAFYRAISARILQLHSGKYRNPQSLPEGAVLVVGSAQSGCQIAEELYQNGRKVYLCVGSAGRAPRRYRGKDFYMWLRIIGRLDKTVDELTSPKAKFAANPQLTGRDGGRTLNLHKFAQDGVVLLGRIQAGQENRISLAPDLKNSLAVVDHFEAEQVKLIDDYIEHAGWDLPAESLPHLMDGYAAEEITELNLSAAGITTIIWARGYDFDFNLVKLPVVDQDGFPIQKRGVTQFPGLFFVGLPWLYKFKSGHIFGVGEDAEYIAAQIADRDRKGA